MPAGGGHALVSRDYLRLERSGKGERVAATHSWSTGRRGRTERACWSGLGEVGWATTEGRTKDERNDRGGVRK